MIEISLVHFIFLGAIIFVIGVFGLLINKKNLIMILLSIELMLLGVNINFVAFSKYLGNLEGQIMTIFLLTIAAAEVAVGLGVIINFYRLKGNINLIELNKMRG